jgi:hypothetical protein
MIGRAIGIRGFLMKLSIILILENIWLNRQLLIECKQRNHLVGDGMERRTLRIVETRPHYTNYFKGIHSFKPQEN